MNLLIIYATTEGHTRQIAEFIGQVINTQNHTVNVYDSAKPIHLNKTTYDAVFLGGSVHQGQHQISLRNFILENKEALNKLPCAFFSVSLVAAIQQDMYQQEAQDYITNFLEEVSWKPLETICIAGALKYSEYDYFKRMVLKLLSGQLIPGIIKGQDTVYTDWDAIQTFTKTFLERIASHTMRPQNDYF
jgi:menaquinone-dependent protoporphyrinogen oxidase